MLLYVLLKIWQLVYKVEKLKTFYCYYSAQLILINYSSRSRDLIEELVNFKHHKFN